MDFIFKCLVVTILVLCIFSTTTVVAYYAKTDRGQMEALDVTSEGPDCRTARWYVMDAIGRFDGMLYKLCNAVGNDRLLIAWRIWLRDELNVTMY